MNMIEVQKGMFSESISFEGQPLILVHPWFLGEEFKDYQLYSGVGNYLDNLNSLLTSTERVIVLEEWHRIHSTCERLRRIRNPKGISLVATFARNPFPDRGSWEVVVRKLKGEKRVSFAGGQLTDNLEEGCLGNTYIRLKEFDISGTFVSGCCYLPPQ